MKNLRFEVAANGVGIAVIDMPGRPFNVFSEDMIDDLESLIDTIGTTPLAGVVIASGKAAFMAGADLAMVKGFTSLRFRATAVEIRQSFSRLTHVLRRLERVGVPTVAAINGLALGGGLELAMACHHRVAADSAEPCLGLPEILLGLLPGAGGTQRLPRLVGLRHGARMLLDGQPISPGTAHAIGLVDELVPQAELLQRASELAARLPAGARWDRAEWRSPDAGRDLITGSDPGGALLAQAGVDRRIAHLYPAVGAICRCLIEGYPVAIDQAIEIEADNFLSLMLDPVAGNMVRTSFLSKTSAAKRAAGQLGGVNSATRRVSVVGGAPIPRKIATHCVVVTDGTPTDAVLSFAAGGAPDGAIGIRDVLRRASVSSAVELRSVGELDACEAVEVAADAGPLGARALDLATRLKLVPIAVAGPAPGPCERLASATVDWFALHPRANLAGMANAVDLHRLLGKLGIEQTEQADHAAADRTAGIALLTRLGEEAASCLGEGLVASAADVDVLAVFGLGYPAWTGGPLSFLDMLRRGEVVGAALPAAIRAECWYED